ncbi:hypothetical protein RSOL_111880 [Rhizoctonia solani AG-3 Rhs1AP]|uniref:Uncharacterized protein n=1 Tax=Rhizoctonia solani AG-3 Rhs1AP TaxID=1086054 RepID=X8J0A4_9AGAM|nr:hypothetical protein RSOL_111880 [Rhizoctonia solani AG-3 Rhs1AP]
MPSFAGFYATRDDCRAWLRANAPEFLERFPQAGPNAVQMKAREFMKAKRIRGSFVLDTLPYPGPPVSEAPWVLMLIIRRSKRKEYLAPVRERDLLLRDLVESQFGLKVSEWAVLWHSNHDPELVTEFLTPETTSSDDK